MTDASRKYLARQSREADANADRRNPEKVAESLRRQGISVRFLAGSPPRICFDDVETFLRLRVTVPELNQFTVRANFNP